LAIAIGAMEEYAAKQTASLQQQVKELKEENERLSAIILITKKYVPILVEGADGRGPVANNDYREIEKLSKL
jgi:hypothetical protein